MSFYDLAKDQRRKLVEQIKEAILLDIQAKQTSKIVAYFSDEDTYIRKSAYLAIGKINNLHPSCRKKIISTLFSLLENPGFKVRQTAVNAAGEIGISNFKPVETIFDTCLFDKHHSVRNAVIGSVKKMGAKNPGPVLTWARKYLHHADKEVRREICHGIELRGRTHPEDVLPILQKLQFDKTTRVRKTLIHVIGQISYKKNCLLTVIHHLDNWENKELVKESIAEIIDVHQRYREFAAMTQQEAIHLIKTHFKREEQAR